MSRESNFFHAHMEVGKFQLKMPSEVFAIYFRTFQLQIVRNKKFRVYLQPEMGLMDYLIAPDWMPSTGRCSISIVSLARACAIIYWMRTVTC